MFQRLFRVRAGQATKRAGGAAASAFALALGLCAASCGGDSKTPPDDPNDPKKFIGVWTFDGGAFNAACGIAFPPQDLKGQNLTFEAGTDSALQITVAGCAIKYDIAMGEARVRTGQTCDVTLQNPALPQGLNVTLAHAAGVFALKNGLGIFNQNGRLDIRGQLPLPPGTPVPMNCTYNISATASKTP